MLVSFVWNWEDVLSFHVSTTFRGSELIWSENRRRFPPTVQNFPSGTPALRKVRSARLSIARIIASLLIHRSLVKSFTSPLLAKGTEDLPWQIRKTATPLPFPDQRFQESLTFLPPKCSSPADRSFFDPVASLLRGLGLFWGFRQDNPSQSSAHDISFGKWQFTSNPP